MKRIVILMASAVCALSMQAQKVNQQLTRLIEQTNARRVQGMSVNQKALNERFGVSFNTDGSIKSVPVIGYLRQGAECPVEQLEANGIVVKRVIDNMVSMSVPVGKFDVFESIDEIIIVNPMTSSRLFNHAAAASSGASTVNDAQKATAAGLPQAYTGKGVVVGIIDRGIDYNHAAFYDAQGNSRVKMVLQYDPFLDGAKIYTNDVEIKSLTTDYNEESHGTHTAATAVGSELGNTMQGVATEADIILAGRNKGGLDDNTCDAIERIFKYADDNHKPCVINISMGTTTNMHDGSSLVCKAIKKYTDDGKKAGHIVVMSAGNDAANKMSVIAKLGKADTDGWGLKTVLGANNNPTDQELPLYVMPFIYMYADDGKAVEYQLKVVDIETGQVYDAAQQITDESGNSTDLPSFDDLDVVNSKGQEVKAHYMSEINTFMLKNKNQRLALFVKGTEGRTIKIIRSNTETKEWNFYIPEKLKDKGYTDGTPLMAFNADACDDAVISVGAYTTTDKWKDSNGQDRDFGKSKITGKDQVVGEIADFSSFCVDDNGTNRPTVIAPGQGLISAFNLYDSSTFRNGGSEIDPQSSNIYSVTGKIEKNGRLNWYGMNAGTSMSSPHVAGIIALWLQAKPDLTTKQVVEILKTTSKNDDWTTNVDKIPSHNKVQAGYGKIDALAGLKKILNTTAIDVVTMDGQRQATPATMYSVDAPVYNMMGQQVDKAQKGLVIYKGKKYLNK